MLEAPQEITYRDLSFILNNPRFPTNVPWVNK